MSKGGTTYYLTYDQVGSLRIVADASGSEIKMIDYDSFGSIISDTNPGFQVPFGFAGGLHDQDTGLVKFGFRDYDPDIGRWTAKDPIRFGGGDVDLYGYVANNPVNFIDPLGLWWDTGHRQLTTGAMTGSPFTTTDINRAIQSNLNVDRILNQANDPAHYMPGNQAAAEALIRSLLERAVELEAAGRHDEAMVALGEGLHTVQDRYSHFEQNGGWIAHATRGCDDPARHPREFEAAQETSNKYVREFLRRTSRTRRR
jgi:RHS repeat-associated protein